jgi:hypothetical protein
MTSQTKSAALTGQGLGFTGESLAWQQLPSYYHTREEQEELRALKESQKVATSPLRTADDFRRATKQIYAKRATTNAVYGGWYRT